MRYQVIVTLNCNDGAVAAPPRMIGIAAQERSVVTETIASLIANYAREYRIDVINVGYSQRWKGV